MTAMISHRQVLRAKGPQQIQVRFVAGRDTSSAPFFVVGFQKEKPVRGPGPVPVAGGLEGRLGAKDGGDVPRNM